MSWKEGWDISSRSPAGLAHDGSSGQGVRARRGRSISSSTRGIPSALVDDASKSDSTAVRVDAGLVFISSDGNGLLRAMTFSSGAE